MLWCPQNAVPLGSTIGHLSCSPRGSGAQTSATNFGLQKVSLARISLVRPLLVLLLLLLLVSVTCGHHFQLEKSKASELTMQKLSWTLADKQREGNKRGKQQLLFPRRTRSSFQQANFSPFLPPELSHHLNSDALRSVCALDDDDLWLFLQRQQTSNRLELVREREQHTRKHHTQSLVLSATLLSRPSGFTIHNSQTSSSSSSS